MGTLFRRQCGEVLADLHFQPRCGKSERTSHVRFHEDKPHLRSPIHCGKNLNRLRANGANGRENWNAPRASRPNAEKADRRRASSSNAV